jgi:hypothetical protein
MKPVLVTVILLLTLALLGWLRADHGFDVRSIVPFLSGREIGPFDWGGLALLVLAAWGLSRLNRGPANGNREDHILELDEPDDTDD